MSNNITIENLIDILDNISKHHFNQPNKIERKTIDNLLNKIYYKFHINKNNDIIYESDDDISNDIEINENDE